MPVGMGVDVACWWRWRWAWIRFALVEEWCRAGFGGVAFRGDSAVLQDEAVVGDVFHQSQIVGRGDHGLAAVAPADQQVDDLALASGIERGGRFVEEQHFGVQHQYGGDRDPLLLTARKAVRRRDFSGADLQHVEHLVRRGGRSPP